MSIDDDFGFTDEIKPAEKQPQAVPVPADDTDYESLSYGKFYYKKVQRLRRRARERRIDVPKLSYGLTKPEKPRVAFWVAAAVSLLLFIGILVLTGIFYNELIKSVSDLDGLGDLFKVLFDPTTLGASFGTSALPGLMLFLVYLLIIALFILPLSAIFYFYRFVRDSFYMAKCSKEEFAKGQLVSGRIFWLIVVLIALTTIFIVAMMYIPAANARLYLGLIYGALVLALGGLLALMIVEKVKAGKWFEGLDEAKKQNYLAHENGLRSVKRRLHRERDNWRRF